MDQWKRVRVSNDVKGWNEVSNFPNQVVKVNIEKNYKIPLEGISSNRVRWKLSILYFERHELFVIGSAIFPQHYLYNRRNENEKECLLVLDATSGSLVKEFSDIKGVRGLLKWDRDTYISAGYKINAVNISSIKKPFKTKRIDQVVTTRQPPFHRLLKLNDRLFLVGRGSHTLEIYDYHHRILLKKLVVGNMGDPSYSWNHTCDMILSKRFPNSLFVSVFNGFLIKAVNYETSYEFKNFSGHRFASRCILSFLNKNNDEIIIIGRDLETFAVYNTSSDSYDKIVDVAHGSRRRNTALMTPPRGVSNVNERVGKYIFSSKTLISVEEKYLVVPSHNKKSGTVSIYQVLEEGQSLKHLYRCYPKMEHRFGDNSNGVYPGSGDVIGYVTDMTLMNDSNSIGSSQSSFKVASVCTDGSLKVFVASNVSLSGNLEMIDLKTRVLFLQQFEEDIEEDNYTHFSLKFWGGRRIFGFRCLF